MPMRQPHHRFNATSQRRTLSNIFEPQLTHTVGHYKAPVFSS